MKRITFLTALLAAALVFLTIPQAQANTSTFSTTVKPPYVNPCPRCYIQSTQTRTIAVLYSDDGRRSASAVLMQPLLVGHTADQCRQATAIYLNDVAQFNVAVVGFASLALISAGSVAGMVAAGTLVNFGAGLGIGGAAAWVMNINIQMTQGLDYMHSMCAH